MEDFMKSATEEQMEMMLMHMDSFSGPYEDPDDIPVVEFSEDSDDSSNMIRYDPAFMNPHPSNTSFPKDSPPAPFAPGGGRWDSDGFPRQAEKRNSMAAMREMIFRIAAMQPVHIDPESVKPPKRKNVKISTDPQSVAARHRRERISERIRILQRLVPGGTKMDTASMLDEAIHYVKFLKNQVQSLERVAANRPPEPGIGFPVPMSSGSYFPAAAAAAAAKGYHQYPSPHNVQHLADA